MSHKHKHRSRKKSRRAPPGTPPGTLIVDPEAPKPVIRAIACSETAFEERAISDPKEIGALTAKWPVVWVNVDGLGDVETIRSIGEVFHLHHLALEDVVNVHQRPKVEPYDEHIYVVARMADPGERLETEQVSLFLGKTWVLTFQEREGDCFDPVRARLRAGKGRIRTGGPDYLAYAILDALVDGFFPHLESYGEHLEELEKKILFRPDESDLGRIYRVKRDLLTLRRSIWPLREALNGLMRDPTPLVQDATRVYLRDCYDHAIQIMELVEAYRELSSGLVDAYMSSISNRMNEVMKVLTIIATIFIPLTFAAGIYGMNFDFMPELHWRYAYPVFWAILIAIAVVLLLFFRRKGWLGGTTAPPEDD